MELACTVFFGLFFFCFKVSVGKLYKSDGSFCEPFSI